MMKFLTIVGLLIPCAAVPLFGKISQELHTAPETFRVILDPYQKTQISAEVRAPVTSVPKKMGDSFEKGELLLQLESDVLKALYEEAEAKLDKAKVELEGREKLFKDKVSSLFDYKRAQADYATAQAEFAEAKKNYRSSQIIAPYNGKVVDYLVEEFELTKVGEPVLEIVDDHILVAKMLVSSALLEYLKPGQKFTITLDETGEAISATITRMGAVIDPSSSTITVEAEIDNSSHKWIAGQRGKAAFQGEVQ